jgi:hypothetical protein
MNLSMNSYLVLDPKNIHELTINLKETLDVTCIDLYCPIFDNLITGEDEDNENELSNKIFKSKYFIKKILDKISTDETSQTTPYIKRIFNAEIKNNYNGKIINKTLFIKVNPILDVIGYILEEFNTDKCLLPNYKANITSNYINNFNNQAYIDAFFSFLASKLTESGKCPCFPLFYGTVSSTINNYKFDITEDYSKIKFQNNYQKNINKLFRIEEIDIDSEIGSITSFRERDCNDGSDYSDCSDGSDYSDCSDGSDLKLEIDNLEIEELDLNEIITENSNSSELNTLNIKEIDKNYNFSEIIDDNKTFKYCTLDNFPTQLLFIENLEYTLDDIIDNEDYKINEDEWKSILFQICFGLAVAQKTYNFVHNDLHSQNIMFTTTHEQFLFYELNSKYYKVPTFGKIAKIIDFGRATFEYNNTIYFSSVFDENGDAEGQYDYPEDNSYDTCKIKPNPSFDLSRLASTIIENFEENSSIYKLLKGWLIDKYGQNLINHEDNFNLYIKIAKNINSAIPKKQLTKQIFKLFLTQKKKIDSKKFIFRF